MMLATVVEGHLRFMSGWRFTLEVLGAFAAVQVLHAANPLPGRLPWWAADARGVG